MTIGSIPGTRIRTQQASDLPGLTDLVARAFGADRTWGERRNLTEIAVPAMVASLPSFDPGLALVAEDANGRIIGYALWYALWMRLRGRRIRAANLAPLAVDPGYMGRGLGGALMKASHETLAAAGISLAFLCGHEGYYPRFGYRSGMFGNVAVKPKAHGGSSDARQRLRAPRPDDEAALRRLWEECHGEVDLALEPDPGFFPWMAWTPGYPGRGPRGAGWRGSGLRPLHERAAIGSLRRARRSPGDPASPLPGG